MRSCEKIGFRIPAQSVAELAKFLLAYRNQLITGIFFSTSFFLTNMKKSTFLASNSPSLRKYNLSFWDLNFHRFLKGTC